MDWPTIAILGLSLACMVIAAIAASKATHMERESRKNRDASTRNAWRVRCWGRRAIRDVEVVRELAGRMTGTTK